MGSVPVNNVGAGNRGLVELNHHIRDEHKEVRDGVVGEGHGLSEDDESRIDGVAENVNDEREGANQAQAAPQRLQQQSQGPVVRWERFLPLRSLKVLLVENDDSTRHVVTALLRNCSYEVITAANGLQAWKILEDLTNHIDLVLTEVVMPCLSGIGLLCKIMSHKTCKNIPVIMMSSHDSMGLVFKCLSKGAVDFLVKPIRKNELKNLWQHVWRRCHSSSGSGSESGIQTQKSFKSRSAEESDNNTGSNDEDDNESIGLKIRDGSDNGSATQSSWTKQAVEVDSPPPMSPWDQVADPPDSTCAQVIHPKPEEYGNEWLPVTATIESQKEDEQLDSIAMGKDLEIGVPTNPDLQLKYPNEKVSTNLTCTKLDKSSEPNHKNDSKQLDKGKPEFNTEKPINELKFQAPDLGTIASCNDSQVEIGESEAPNDLSKITQIKDKRISDAKGLPSLELSLKRLRGVGDVGTTAHDDRNVLKHSDLSAFSRYNTASTANQAPTGNIGSCSVPPDNSSDAVKTGSVYNIQSQSNSPPNQQSNGSRSNNDMGSTTKSIFTKPKAVVEKLASTSTAKCLHPSVLHPMQNACICPSQQDISNKADNATWDVELPQSKGSVQQVQVQHHHHHYHHHHHHVHNVKQKQPVPEHDDLSLNNMAADAPLCGSSNVFGGPTEGNVGNYSLNGNASGSNHGSNGQNGSSTAVNTCVMNVENDNRVSGKKGAGDSVGSGTGSGVDQNRFAQRVAALTKFRQKRKERCFEKKVRYQSRKRLAEQRPRVRGQFVRQAAFGNTNQDTNC
ncbi:PREDICTED: two-component response regulator-like PRR37 [Nelumbo nucifera]|uniref:Two-component response regulator-like PRR37 n=1 Tax=Nelumbo nucifera TaxID=4432 RepID=A0A1U7ZHW6_NELNU|nr:PREDICTED: two-component response regulator-like PRR37 [Nelumbo nucifera]